MGILYLTNIGSNPLLTCAPSCLTTVSIRTLPTTVIETCPSAQDDGLCSFIAATDIETISSKTMWSCTTDGLTTTDPCVATIWSGITCDGGYVDSITLDNLGIIG